MQTGRAQAPRSPAPPRGRPTAPHGLASLLQQPAVAGAGAAGALLCAWLFASSTVWLQVVGVMLGGGALAFVAAIVLRPITSADAGALERVLRSGGMGALVPVFRRVSG